MSAAGNLALRRGEKRKKILLTAIFRKRVVWEITWENKKEIEMAREEGAKEGGMTMIWRN